MQERRPPFPPFMLASWSFAARFLNCSNSLNLEAKINFNTTKQNELKWRKTCTGLKFDLEHFNGPHTKFVRDSLYKHPVDFTCVKFNFQTYILTFKNYFHVGKI